MQADPRGAGDLHAGTPRRGPRFAGRAALIALGALALLLVVSQFALPRLGERAIESRLTENGGIAEVQLRALPAARLLWGSGDRLAVEARGVELDLGGSSEAFSELDRFGEVAIVLDDSVAGPVELESFVLTREGDEPYKLRAEGGLSAADLARFGAERANLPGAGLIGGLIGATGVGAADVPLELDLELTTEPDGGLNVDDGGSNVAGVPTGPLVELLTSAIVERL
jgi:hypothetical protein